ncbi:MAG: bifunctional tetrahydrofolate synthase/dihydrofolate synthase [Halioglobus sp.]
MTKLPLNEWLQRLEKLHPNEIELGLERVGKVAAVLGLDAPQQPVVTVAGTNGKGSTVAVIEALVQASGRTAGVFSSPHLFRFNERIRVGGAEAGDDEIAAAFAAIDQARGAVSLTYFEFAALAALQIFQWQAPDIIVLEVGLGGRLDAVNILDASIAVITSIALDHQHWLGSTREAIAVEKAGVLRRDSAVVVADPEPPASLLSEIQRIGARPVLRCGHEFGVETQAASGVQGVTAGSGDVADKWTGYVQRSAPKASGQRRRLPLLPASGLLPVNCCAALQVAELLGLDLSAAQIEAALAGCDVPGRRQLQQVGGVHYLFDVAHNPAAVEKLLEFIHTMGCEKRIIAVFSAMADKDIAAMIACAGDSFDAWFVADQPGNPRAASAAALTALLHEAGHTMISGSKNLRQALRRAQRVASPGDTLVVFGSFYTVAEVMPLVGEKHVKREAV